MLRFSVYTLLALAVLFLASGRLNWGMAWVYGGMLFASTVVSRILVMLKYPDLIAERAGYRERKDAKDWDRVLVVLVALYGPLATWIVAGLDKRFGWSPGVPLTLQWVAAVVVALGFAFAAWAMVVNRFFAAVVRIQEDRGHAVVSDGPYRVVRHPAYAGGVLSGLAAPVMLGALWALVPAGLTAIVLVVRTALEDRTLLQELPGYTGYAQRTRYRLLPGVW